MRALYQKFEILLQITTTDFERYLYKEILSVIILTFLIFIGCNESQQQSVSQNDRFELVPDPDKDLKEKYAQQEESLKGYSIFKRTDRIEFSEAMTGFIELLKQDNYVINPNEDQSELCFTSYKEEFQVDRTISFSKERFSTIFAKRKNKLEGMTDNWYPSFVFTEIFFPNEQEASKGYHAISEIIDNQDLFNEKDYDYILKNGNRLIYVSCGAKIFEKFAFAYKEKIKDLIMKNKL